MFALTTPFIYITFFGVLYSSNFWLVIFYILTILFAVLSFVLCFLSINHLQDVEQFQEHIDKIFAFLVFYELSFNIKSVFYTIKKNCYLGMVIPLMIRSWIDLIKHLI